MLCALTVRKLKPGSFDEFLEAFRPHAADDMPRGWVRFHALRDRSDPDRIVTFGFFDGTFEELEATQAEGGYDERRDRVGQYVDSVEVNGVFDVVTETVPSR